MEKKTKESDIQQRHAKKHRASFFPDFVFGSFPGNYPAPASILILEPGEKPPYFIGKPD